MIIAWLALQIPLASLVGPCIKLGMDEPDRLVTGRRVGVSCWMPAPAGAAELWRPRSVYPLQRGSIRTKHEIWIVTAVSLAPIPLLTAIAVIAALRAPGRPSWRLLAQRLV